MENRRYSVEEINLHMFRSVPILEEWINIYTRLYSFNYQFERIPGLSQVFQPDYFDSKFPKVLGEAEVFVDANEKEHDGDWFYVLSASKGYFIPVFNEDGFIIRLRVRKDSGDPKYVWFSSTHYIGVEKTITKARRNGVSSGAPIGGLFSILISDKIKNHLGKMIALGAFSMFLTTLFFSLTTNPYLSVILCILMGPLYQIRDISQSTIFQDVLPKEERGS